MSAYTDDDVEAAIEARKAWLRNEDDSRSYLEAVLDAVLDSLAWDDGTESEEQVNAETAAEVWLRKRADATERGAS